MPMITLLTLLLGGAPVSVECDVEQAIAASRREAAVHSYESSSLLVGALHGPMRWSEFALVMPHHAERPALRDLLGGRRFYYVLLVPADRHDGIALGGLVTFVDKATCAIVETIRQR